MARELESLPPDVLILILTAVASLKDLHAFIRASPTLYQIFLQMKASTLLGICASQLGPATRDAIILVHTTLHPFTSRPAELYRDRVEEVVAQWRRPLLAGKGQWPARGVSVEEAVQLVRINRTVQDMVDLYARVRFRQFEDIFRQVSQPQQHSQPITAGGTWSLSTTERQHLAQAFVRRQAILNLYCVPGQPPLYNKNFFLGRVLGLFAPWELEQISQADSFAFWLCSAFRDCKMTPEGVVPTAEWWREQLVAIQDATVAAMQGGGTIPPVPRSRYLTNYYPQLPVLRRKVAEAAVADPGLVDRMIHWQDPFDGDEEREEWEVQGLQFASGYEFLHTSDPLRSASQTAHQPPSPPSVPCNAACESPLEAPWGWRDATADVRGDRWGVDLIAPPPHGALSANDWTALVRDFAMWRWGGFVFWDKDRAEALRDWGPFSAAVRTGWLRPPWMQETR